MPNIGYEASLLPGSEHRARTPEGYLICIGVPIARTGYQTYKARELQPSGVEEIDKLPPEADVPVYRDEKDVFDPRALASFEGKSVTKTHPQGGFLTPDNDGNFSKGHAQNIRGPATLPDGSKAILADLIIKDSQLMQYIDDGVMEEVSCGYRYKLAPMDDEYGFKMINIVGNHVAIVPNGRAGNYVRVLDASPEEGGSTMELKDFKEFFKELGLRLVANDAESELITVQHKKDKEALELKNRVMDAEEEKREKEEKEAADKRMKDAEAKIEEVSKKQAETKEAVDALMKTIKDGFEDLKKEKEGEDAKECTCGAEEGEAHDDDCAMMKDKKAKDSDLIPSPTLHGSEVPENPIPGADAKKLLDGLRKLKPIIADSGNKEAIAAFNRAMTAAKKGKVNNDSDDYKQILEAAAKIHPDAGHLATDRKEPKQGEYQEMMKRFSRLNPAEWKEKGLLQ